MRLKFEYNIYMVRGIFESLRARAGRAWHYAYTYDFSKIDLRKLDLRNVDIKRIPAAALKGLQNEKLSIGLMIVSAVFAAVLAFKTANVGWTMIFTKSAVQRMVEQSKPSPAETSAKFAAMKKRAEEIKGKNFFVPLVAKVSPPPVVNGILGDRALIGGKWCCEGEKAGDAVVKAIGASEVTVEWQGKELKISPINAPAAPEGQNPQGAHGQMSGGMPAGMPGMSPANMVGQMPQGQANPDRAQERAARRAAIMQLQQQGNSESRRMRPNR